MPIIVDTNCFASVFSRNSTKHSDFKPVLDWVLFGKGMIVYGGKKYNQELIKASKYLRVFRLLKEAGKIIRGDDSKIDDIETCIIESSDTVKFNDPHLLAICIVTKCILICSEDSSSIKYVTNKKYYSANYTKPVYYTKKGNSDLLCDKYVNRSLKPLCRIKKSLAMKVAENI